MIFIINVVKLKLNNVIKPSADQSTWFFVAQNWKRGNASGRKGSIRDLQSDRQLHCHGADRIHCEWDKLRHAGSAPRHSPDQPELLLSEEEDRAADHEAEDGKDWGGAERTDANGVVKNYILFIKNVIIIQNYK